jgi:hypothetical protein
LATGLSSKAEVSRDEIVACAHIADVLISRGYRELAINVVEAIHTVISLNELSVVDEATRRRAPYLVAINNKRVE